MNYLLYGEEKYLIDCQVKDIISKYNIDEINISRYNLENDSISALLEDINTISLFSSKKLIIVENAFIFNRVQAKKIDNIDDLEKALSIKNENVIVVFISYQDKVDMSKKITKAIKNNGYIKEFNSKKNVSSDIKDMLEDYKMSIDAINELINRVGNNLEIIYQEIEKLKIYKFNEKEITLNDVCELSPEVIDIDIFKFIDNIINKNKASAIKTYRELLKINEEPIKIVALLASKFRLMYQASILTRKGYTEETISEILKVHKYPVHLAITTGYKYNPKVLLEYLNKLADLDIGIKTGEKDKEISLELFILEL